MWVSPKTTWKIPNSAGWVMFPKCQEKKPWNIEKKKTLCPLMFHTMVSFGQNIRRYSVTSSSEKYVFPPIFFSMKRTQVLAFTKSNRERSGSVAECLTEGPQVRASPASLRCGPWARLVKPRKTRPCLTERLLMVVKNQIKQTKQKGSGLFFFTCIAWTPTFQVKRCVLGTKAKKGLHVYLNV